MPTHLTHQHHTHKLTFDQVSCIKGDAILFDKLSFELHSGQILWIQGDNGIGKTSILRIAAGLSQPNEGNIAWQEEEAQVNPRHLIAYQGHNNGLHHDFTVKEEAALWAELYDNAVPIENYIQAVGLQEKTAVKTAALSAGQKRRLALLRLMISERPLWIMDEPKASMDQSGQSLITSLMDSHLAAGGSILAATHDQTTPLGRHARRLTLETIQ